MFEPRLDILPAAQRSLWPALVEIPPSFVLYGGTALALRLGHRSSGDLDFFSADPFHAEALQRSLRLAAGAECLQKTENTLTIRTSPAPGARLSFFGGVNLGQVERPDLCPDNGLSVASLKDLFATKLNVLYQRAEAKDYLDVAALLQAGLDLELGLGCARAAYGSSFNLLLPLKALAYFEDGDLPSLPTEIKERLLAAARSFRQPAPVPLHSDRVRARS